MIDRARAVEVALAAALESSALIMQIYQGSFEVSYKAKDDPVTRADHESNALLCARIGAAFPGLPLVAEESDPSSYAGFGDHESAFFIDPLDGTREFVARNGEFAVMLGLAEKGRAVLSVIVAPAWGRAFVGIVGQGAWEVAADGSKTPIHVSARSTVAGASMLLSRSRKPSRMAALAETVGAGRVVLHGSSGLKAVLVAVGAHDAYVQPGTAGMRWDACASDALVQAAGGRCTEADGAPFDYANGELLNARGLVATNGRIHDEVLAAIASS